jgi:hypothetical protein
MNRRIVFTTAFWLVIGSIIFFAFQSWVRTGFLNEKVNGYQAAAKEQISELNKSGFADSPAGESFTQSFVSTYFNVPSDDKGRAVRETSLQGYLADGLKVQDLEDLSHFQGKRVLKSASLYDVKDVKRAAASYVYRVEYELFKTTEKSVQVNGENKGITKETKQESDQSLGMKEVLFVIPVLTDGKDFNVSEQPYFNDLPGKTRLKAVQDEMDPSLKNVSAVPALQQFATQFFTAYTSNSLAEMSYLMKKPERLQGYTYNGLGDFTVYDAKKGDYLVKAEVLFTEENTGLVTKHPFTLLVSKQNHNFFVESLTHTVGG